MRRIAVSSLVLALALVTGGCASRASTPPVTKAAVESSAAASQAATAGAPVPVDVIATAPVGADGVPVLVQQEVDRFAGEHVTLKPSTAGANGGPDALSSWAVANEGSQYTFNGRGILVRFSSGAPGSEAEPGASPLTDPQITAKARGYVRSHFDARQASWTAKLERRVSGLDQNNEKVYEISVELRERVGTLPGPNYIRLVMSKQGEVVDFTRDDGPVTVASTKPRVGKDAAVSAVAKAVHYTDPEVTSAVLLVVREPGSAATALAWRIELNPPGNGGPMHGSGHVWADVDAQTGAVIVHRLTK